MKTIVAREVIEAKIIKDYTIEVVFDDLKKGIVDLRKFLGKGIFKALLDKKKFRQISSTFSSALNNVNRKHMKTLKALA